MNRQLAYSFNILRFIVKYTFIVLSIGIILLIITLGGAYSDLKAAGTIGLSGKNHITAAVSAAQAQDWQTARGLATEARIEFEEASAKLEATRSNTAIKNLRPIRNQINDLDYLLKTAEILSRSLERILPIAGRLAEISSGYRNFSDFSTVDKADFLKTIYESEPELNGLKANIDLALLNLDRIHRVGVLWPVYSQLSDIKQELSQASYLLGKSTSLIKLLPALAGYPVESRFLILLQNNDELRPTGGFIGVYGTMVNKDGEIISIDTDDSYHIDAPASISSWNMQPPAPLRQYLKVDKWYFRDSNWSPDWPLSARKVSEIFHGESAAIGQPAQPFTGIIALTPEFIGDLFRLVGPIVVRGETYDADNFQPLLQYNVEIAYKDQNISSWDRKDIVDELMNELKNRLFNLSSDKISGLIATIDNNISKKNIQIFFYDSGWESLVREIGADGAIQNPAGDYLMVVDANLGAFKSDAVVKKDISYTLSQSPSGLEASVRLDYLHEGGFDWRTTRYRSYTRIYAPLGSRLIGLKGVNGATADLSATDDQELNKTVFGFFWTIEPGSGGSAVLNYTLPDKINQDMKNGNYSLYIQRQPGSRINSLKAIYKPAAGAIKERTDNLNADKIFKF